MIVKTVQMDIVDYVNKVGKQVNDHTKYSAKIDRISIKNIIIISNIDDVIFKVENDKNIPLEDKELILKKLNGYLNCLKKEMNFYPSKNIDEDCILTEVDNYIIQE